MEADPYIVNYILRAVMYSCVRFYVKKVLEYCMAFFSHYLTNAFLNTQVI
jgi:hypothetical protein